MTEPLATPPLAPAVLETLKRLGICTRQELQAVGAVRAYLLLQAAGLTVTRSVLWRLQATCYGGEIGESDQRQLLEALRNHPPVDVFPPRAEMEMWMQAALNEAHLAAEIGEVPVGAVVVRRGEIVARAHNLCVSSHAVGHHAEMLALERAGSLLRNYRLDDCDVYVTLEPCAMCAGALIQARVRRVIFAAAEPKTGAAGSITNLFHLTAFNRHTAVLGGVLETQSRALLQAFFRNRRRLSEKKD